MKKEIIKKTHHPLVGKGIVFPLSVSAVCWVDLLGYGRLLADGGFNPLHENSRKAQERLRLFHKGVEEASGRYFRTFVVNDGAVIYRDLSMRSRSVTHDFFMRCWHLFNILKKGDLELGQPGPRMVLAAGFRLRNQRCMVDRDHLANIMKRFENGRISAEQAIREAARTQAAFGTVPDLQANFAFTKAYVAEQSGTKGGLDGSNCFVDMLLFSNHAPPWLDLGDQIAWHSESLNLRGEFCAVRDIRKWAHPEGGPSDIRCALQIAQILADDPNVLTSLRKSSVGLD